MEWFLSPSHVVDFYYYKFLFFLEKVSHFDFFHSVTCRKILNLLEAVSMLF